jgi:hypothetical protein
VSDRRTFTVEEVLQHNALQDALNESVCQLAEEVQALRETYTKPRYPLLAKCYFNDWETAAGGIVNPLVIRATFHENWQGGGSCTVEFPATYLGDAQWVEKETAKLQRAYMTSQQALEAAADAAAQATRIEELAKLKELQEKYPEAVPGTTYAIAQSGNPDLRWNMARGWVSKDDTFDLFESHQLDACLPLDGVWKIIK